MDYFDTTERLCRITRCRHNKM